MKKLLVLALGLLTALGGFVDISEIVFASQAGAQFGHSLLWTLVVGVIGIMVYSEMSGRVAAVSGLTVFDIIRRDYPPKLGFLTLVLSIIVNLLTCAAEIGGVALILQLLAGFPYQALIPVVLVAIFLIVWYMPYQGIERLFGYMGAALVLFVIIGIKLLGNGADVPGIIPEALGSDTLSYWYFAVGMIAALLMPYQIYFYSSGGIEEGWKPTDMASNRINAFIGFLLGTLLVAGIMVASAQLFLPAQISPDFIGTPVLLGLATFGQIGVLLLLLGMLFSIGGSAVETAFSGAYNLSQYAGWRWGKHLPRGQVPKFTKAWIAMLAAGALIIATGIDPVALTEYAVIFSVVVMPLTYYPIFKAARDKKLMGTYANGRLATVLGWAYLVIIMLVAVAAVPLMLLTHQGRG